MMSFELLMKGFLIGMIIAAPVGPTGIVCVQRIISIGRMYGLFTGIGAGIADMFWATITLYGVHHFAPMVQSNERYLRIFAAIFLAILGIRTFTKKLSLKEVQSEKRNYLKAFGSGFLLTIFNPVLIGVFMALYASMGVIDLITSYWHAVILLGSIFLGSVSWWIILGGIYTFFKHKMHKDVILWINYSAGVILVLISIVILLKTTILGS